MSFESFQEKVIDLFQDYDKSVSKEKGEKMGQENLIVIVNNSKELRIMGNEYNSDYDLFPLIVKKYHKLLADIDYDGHKLDQESIDNSIISIYVNGEVNKRAAPERRGKDVYRNLYRNGK